MTSTLPTGPKGTILGDPLSALLPSWARHLRAENKSPRTVQSYQEAARLFVAYLESEGLPTRAADIRRGHIEAWEEHLIGRFRPGTAANRHRSLQQLFRWLEDEELVPRSPMAKMRPPAVPEQPVAVLSDEDLRRLLSVCEGKRFVDRRDAAILRVFMDTGVRP